MLYIMENQNSKSVFSVPSYKGTTFNNGETNRRNYKTKNAISIIKQKIDSNLHLRIYKELKCMVFGDIDYCPKDIFNEIMELISNEFNVTIDDISYTICKKPNDIITSHWVIPKLSTDFETLKKVVEQEKFKKYTNVVDGKTHRIVDSAPYKDSWFRLPYQTSEEKELMHKIKQGKTAHFFIHDIMEDAQPFIYDCPTQEIKSLKILSDSPNATNLKEIERMALKLGSFFDSFDEWVKLGMIIHYETNGSDEGLELFDKLSQTFDKYDGVQAVSKQYYTCKYTKSNAVKIGSLYKWFYDAFPEDKMTSFLTKNNEYMTTKEKFEKLVFMLNNPICFVIEHENAIQMVKLNELKIWAKGKFPKINTIDEEGKNKKKDFIDLWLEDPNHRTKDEMKFDPKMIDDNKYNMYKGSVYSVCDSKIDETNNIFFKLLKHISNDPVVYEYFKCWISHIVKTPYKKTNVAIILYSMIGGVGKNAITDALCKLFKNYSGHIENIDDITKNFNSHLTNKLFIYGDEINANAKKVSDKLKQVITRPKQNLEKKGIDSIEIDDYSNYIFTTNNENCFKIEEGDRRLLMVKCPDKALEKEDYKAFYNYINDSYNICDLYNYFLTYDNSKYEIGVDRVIMTAYKKQLAYENTPAYTEMFYKEPGQYAGQCISSTHLLDMAKDYAKKNYLSSNFTMTTFGTHTKELFNDYVKRSNGIKYDFRNLSTTKFKEHLYKKNKDYYLYVNNLESDYEPKFEEKAIEKDVVNPLDA